MKGCLTFFLFIVIICIVLYATNPPYGQHEELLFNEFRDDANQKGGFGGWLNKIGVSVVDNLNLLSFTYQNYYLFSTVSYEDEIVSVGFLNKVIIVLE